MSVEERCGTPFGDFILRRESGSQRAWDGADLLLLDYVSALNPTPSTRVAIFHDAFGALTVALRHTDAWTVSDSMVANSAIRFNTDLNRSSTEGLEEEQREELRIVVSAVDGPELMTAIGGPVDIVLWSVGKATSEVLHGASLLQAISHESTVVLAAGMDKHLPPKTADVLRQVGDVTTHPGKRKAHVFEVRPRAGANSFDRLDVPPTKPVQVPEFELTLSGGPSVFSAEKFDLGTRLLANHVVAGDVDLDATQVVDLGCGSGALGILALRKLPQATVHFLDESAQAIATAKRNVSINQASLESLGRATFIQANVFADVMLPPIDLILCNPPFHHTNAMDDEVAWQMFTQSQRVMRPGGELWVVANRHLGYHAKLSRIFTEVMQISAHPKFVVLAARD